MSFLLQFFALSVSSCNNVIFDNKSASNYLSEITSIFFALINEIIQIFRNTFKNSNTFSKLLWNWHLSVVGVVTQLSALLNASERKLTHSVSVTSGLFLTKKINQYGTLVHFGADFARLVENNAASNRGHDLSKSFVKVKSIYHLMRKI